MAGHSEKFAELFKKYRLKAEIPTLSKFGHLLAEKGFNYEDSIFSHWQKGSRVPQYRIVVLNIIKIFCDKGVITNTDQANEILISVNQNNLSPEEIDSLSLKTRSEIFQVPSEITNFTGREDLLKELTSAELTGKVVLLHGPAGVGKTSLAIKLGHFLKDKYTDGVLWYKIEEDNISDVFLSIARTLGEDISGISDLQVRGTVVRSLLASKSILLFLDSAETCKDITLLIPNSQLCTTIITSQKGQIKTPIGYVEVELKAFSKDEALRLFKGVLKNKYSRINQSTLIKISRRVGNLPLALHLLARELAQRKNLVVNEDLLLEGLHTEDKSLDSAISLSYGKLDTVKKTVLVSASLFKGKDFSAKSIGYINGLSLSATIIVLQSLVNLSLLENSTRNRYRIHPAIKDFVRDKLNYPRSSYLSVVATLLFSFFFIWWIYLQLFVEPGSILWPAFASSYFVVALYGGVFGISTSLNWGGLKTLLGRAIFMFSLGLFAQVFGQTSYAFYNNILKIDMYPSIGDVGYFAAIPLYIYGLVLLSESSGIKINFQLFKKEPIALVVPVVMLLGAYFLFLQDYEFNFSQPVKIFLDFGYPLGEAIYISLVIIIFILSRTILDGIMRSKALFLLIALFMQFIMDSFFVYDYDNYTSGNYIDFLGLLAYYFMTIALLSLRSIQINVKNVYNS